MVELITIGYEGLSVAEFFGILDRCHVSLLVDIRELPISLKPGFAKAALSAAAQKRGIKYEHLVELGCPRDIRHEYRADGDWARYTKRFKAYSETQADALERLAGWMQDERCCLLCYEQDFNFCHRSFVAEKVAGLADEAKINHLTGPMTGRVVWRRLVPA